ACLQDCFARNSERPRRTESLEWLYLKNTAAGRLFVDVAEQDERVVAIYASLPGWFRVDGRRLLALQSLDTLTDGAYRGRGLFLSLARSLYARAGGAGCAFVYGFPNGNSAAGFFGKLGWAKLDPVPFLVRPLRMPYVAGKVERLKPLAHWLPNIP